MIASLIVSNFATIVIVSSSAIIAQKPYKSSQIGVKRVSPRIAHSNVQVKNKRLLNSANAQTAHHVLKNKILNVSNYNCQSMNAVSFA
jgi:hypothetical protein